VISGTPDGLRREVQLLDAPGAALYTKTVEGLLRQEIEHAREHLGSVAKARATRGR
jgi:hypothetical protein